jgi:CRISPR/Cas system-associated endoribonuclease Cas2
MKVREYIEKVNEKLREHQQAMARGGYSYKTVVDINTLTSLCVRDVGFSATNEGTHRVHVGYVYDFEGPGRDRRKGGIWLKVRRNKVGSIDKQATYRLQDNLTIVAVEAVNPEDLDRELEDIIAEAEADVAKNKEARQSSKDRDRQKVMDFIARNGITTAELKDIVDTIRRGGITL